jgi:hypothetical protein
MLLEQYVPVFLLWEKALWHCLALWILTANIKSPQDSKNVRNTGICSSLLPF